MNKMYTATEINNCASLKFRMHAQFIDSQHTYALTHSHSHNGIYSTGKRTPNCIEYIQAQPLYIKFLNAFDKPKKHFKFLDTIFIALYCYLLSRRRNCAECLQCRTLTWNKLNWQLWYLDESSTKTTTAEKMDTTKNCINRNKS